ncbi:Bug family tripartite tricarboxylate transporter substrate binding protein [Muricoccus radiodurans]|uniref:Bug family tripartite tricarboxylate transporter substrate binding protein n=1 Tax=Muricoccus radiodurans TaxID=2231721 RepID=UPI003CF079CB
MVPLSPLKRRALLAAGAAAALPLGAAAQSFPNKPIRIVVPNAAGGVADLTARTVGTKLSERLGQPVVIDNRPGAGGVVAGQAVLQAAPDGHTLMVATNANAISVGLFRNLPFDPINDFAPVGLMGTFAIAVLVAPDSPLRRPQDLLERMRREPGRVNVGTISAGSTQNLAAVVALWAAGADATIVPFSSTPALITALLRKDVDVAFEIVSPIWGQVRDGAVRVLAVTSANRFPNLPDAPTLAESGLANYDVTSWNALVARAGTPPELVARLNRDLNAVLADPAVRDSLLAVGVAAQPGTPDEFGRRYAEEARRWRGVIAHAGIERQ